ncbi:MAG: class I SAM-dependent methyltransferase [Mariniblastus sp.]|nr:class I SAM-dependent methyltransferase [Mariniblastus sp.]
MFASKQYELVDFGDGEKLERFAGVLVRRDCPAANQPKARPMEWDPCALSFSRQSNNGWGNLEQVPDRWTIELTSGINLELSPTPFGHLGLFAEQSVNWQWIDQRRDQLNGLRVINLFAYTGATTLALAAAGASVTHVDSAHKVVRWARKNAELSGLEQAPIRWIVDDALTFIRREIKRGRPYDMVVADPPAFGHGLKRQAWKLERDMGELLKGLSTLTGGKMKMGLLTGHSLGYGARDLASDMARGFQIPRSTLHTGQMNLKTRAGRALESGFYVRFDDRQDKGD